MGFVPFSPLPEGAEVHIQILWGSIGWATGAALGIELAIPCAGPVLFTGEGSHQYDGRLSRNHGARWDEANYFRPQQRRIHGRRAPEEAPTGSITTFFLRTGDTTNFPPLSGAATGSRRNRHSRVSSTPLRRESQQGKWPSTSRSSEVELDFPAGLAMAHERRECHVRVGLGGGECWTKTRGPAVSAPRLERSGSKIILPWVCPFSRSSKAMRTFFGLANVAAIFTSAPPRQPAPPIRARIAGIAPVRSPSVSFSTPYSSAAL